MEPETIDDFQLEGAEPTSDISYKYVEMNTDLQFIEKPVEIEEFKDNMNKRNFELEYKLLRRLTESQMHAQCLKEYNPEIAKLNRYNNIIPFKHTMVELPGKGDPETKNEADTYINASFISTSKKDDTKAFIATQGPVEASKSHFWRMVWVNNVSVVIMLCNFKENGKAQCDNYWCDKTGQSPFESEGLRVKLLEENDMGKDVHYRKFSVENTNPDEPSEPKTVVHYQWLGWPDHGIPKDDDFDSIENLLSIMHEEKKKAISGPIVIHCSAGIGRTGTLLSIFNLDMVLKGNLKKKGDEKKIRLSVFGTVRRLREQRWGMVNTKDQYSLVYKFISNKIDTYLKNLDA